MNNLISIIIPVYNVEKYLEECLDSILKQTYKNFEAILIDDGSKDNSGKICDEYAQKDARFKVIHKQNEGVSVTRNLALDMANGEYITFLDSDDMLEEGALDFLYKEMVNNNSDLVIGGVKDIKNGKVICQTNEYKEILNKEDALKEFFDEKMFKCVIWAKMYRREIIGDERFNKELTIAEDFDFLYRILKKVDAVVVNTSNTVCYYRHRDDSAMRQKYDKKFEKEIDLSESVLKDVEKNFVSLKDNAIRRYQRVTVSCIDKYFRENGNINDIKYLLDRMNKYPIKLDVFQKIKLFMLLYCKCGLKLIYKLCGKM